MFAVRVFLSAFFWIYLGVSLAVFWFAVVIPWLFTLPFDRRRRFAHWYACVWANHYIKLSPFWEMRHEGLEHFDKDEAFVIVANHQSIADIMVMFTTFRQFRWVSKHTVFYVPFMGWMMKMANYIGIRRGDAKSRQKMLRACKDHLTMGNSIMIFPEGTRSEDRQLRAFKRGAFQLAVDTGHRVLPILIDGTHNALPKDTWIFRNEGKITLQVRTLPPLDPADYGNDPQRLKEAAKQTMAEQLADLRAEPEPDGFEQPAGHPLPADATAPRKPRDSEPAPGFSPGV